MDFRTGREKYYNPQPRHRAPVAQVPPAPQPQPKPHHAEQAEPKRVRKSESRQSKNLKRILQIAGAVFVLAVIIWLVYGYITTKNQLEQQKKQPNAQTPTQQTVSKVSALVDVPSNETPTLATISNADALRKTSKFNQSFFADAKNGDILLVYSKNNKAIVYRPSTNKIIASGPYTFASPASNN
jgi:cytoskeletal protein RodZ